MGIRPLLSPFIFMVILFILIFPDLTKAAQIEIIDGFEVGQKLILIRGPIEIGDDEKFFEMAKKADRAVVLLESAGGSVEAGLSIGSEIAMKEFTTLVLDGAGCHSICAVIWVSGNRRYMSPNAKISVHAAYRLTANADGAPEAAESGVANANIGAYLNELGLSRDAIEYFTMASPSEELLPLTPDIAQVLDIDVYLQDGAQVIAPSERPTPRRITRWVAEYIGLSANCGELFGIDSEFWKVQAEAALKQGHALFGGETIGLLIPEYTHTLKTELQRDGVARWCISAEANLRADAMPTGVSGPSFDCGRAITSTELAVCDSPSLWALDNAMANLYFLFKRDQNAGRSAEFLDSQRAWLQRRDACGADLSCLVERYSSRLFDFGM